MLEKMRVKQESDDSSDVLRSSTTKSDRQVALETLKRKRRREDTDSDHENRQPVRRSESPHPLGKVRKLENASAGSRSMSPPMTGNSKHAPKSSEIYKKKKSGSSSSKESSTSNATGKPHQLTNGTNDNSGSPSHNNNNTKNSSVTKNGNNDIDFVRVKPKDQVPIATFWTYLEPYFRPVTEEDREYLLQKGDDTKPYLVPPLGQPYLEVWAEEDRGLPSSRPQSPVPNSSSSTPSRHDSSNDINGTTTNGQSTNNNNNSMSHINEKLKYFSSKDTLTDDHLMTEELSGGTLTERLLSSLVAEDLGVSESDLESYVSSSHDNDNEDIDMNESNNNNSGGRAVVELSSKPPTEIVDFEERLKRELRYAGLFGDDDVDWNAKEDDEICAELRKLSRELKEQVAINEFRKKRLLDVCDKQIQYEQYRHVLDNLDSQVEQCYIKRFRTQKSKKRKAQSAPKSTLSENAIHAMEKRRMWIEKLGGIFQDKNMVMPTRSIYETDPDPNTANDD
ncbi:unnamed protein product [Cunninghamella blakesleeana]